MKYTYTIENLNHMDNTIHVVYIPEDERLMSHFKRIPFDGEDTTTILKNIVANAPVELWELETERLPLKDELNHLIGKRQGCCFDDTFNERIESQEKVPVNDIVLSLKEHIKGELGNILNNFKGEYSPEEVETWDKLFQQAQEVVHVNGDLTKVTISVRYLSDMAEAKGRDLLEFAKKVIEKHDVYESTKEQLVVEVNKRLGVIDSLVQQHESKEIGRQTLIEELEKIPFFQPVSEPNE